MFLSGICWHCHGMKMIHEKFRKYNFVEGKRTEGREDAKEKVNATTITLFCTSSDI